ncbi:hypothetical protein BH20VER1_BH20VER1_08670 [soil metagenome]
MGSRECPLIFARLRRNIGRSLLSKSCDTVELPPVSSFFSELKRRKVYRVAAAYGVVAYAIIELADITFGAYELPDWAIRLVIALVLFGFPVALIFAWIFDVTQTYALLKENDRALQLLDHLLTVPSGLSVPLLRLDPMWDDLRQDPRFEEMLTKHAR